MLPKEKQNEGAKKLEDKIVNGITHCANYMCNGCPYKPIFDDGSAEMYFTAAAYVRCMQKLIEDIYKNIKEVKSNASK